MERIEDTLVRIENKLDGKVSYEDLRPVNRRIELLEAGETPLGRVIMKQWEQLTQVVNDIVLHGSKEAQEALRRIEVNEADIEGLKSSDLQKRATDKTVAAASEKYYKRLTSALSVAVVMLMVGQLLIALHG